MILKYMPVLANSVDATEPHDLESYILFKIDAIPEYMY